MPDIKSALSTYGGLIMSEFSQSRHILTRLVGANVQRYLEFAMALDKSLTLGDYIAAIAERMRLQRVWQEWIETFDALLCPVYCDNIPKIDADICSFESHANCAQAMSLCRASSLVGFSTVSVAVNSSGVLPIGIQLISSPFEEIKALRLAREIETRIGFYATQQKTIGDRNGQ